MIGGAVLMCTDDHRGGLTCRSTAAIEAAHRQSRQVDVAVPRMLRPDVERPMMVFSLRGRSIATNGVQATAFARAMGPVSLGGMTLDRAAFLSRHPTLRDVEAELLRTAVQDIADEEFDHWSASCADAIRERHRRLSMLRAELGAVRKPDQDHASRTRIARTVDQIIANESRGAWV